MNDCPRCGGTLERLRLEDVETVACNRCGFADVPVDHDRQRIDAESWQDAFNRFYKEFR